MSLFGPRDSNIQNKEMQNIRKVSSFQSKDYWDVRGGNVLMTGGDNNDQREEMIVAAIDAYLNDRKTAVPYPIVILNGSPTLEDKLRVIMQNAPDFCGLRVFSKKNPKYDYFYGMDDGVILNFVNQAVDLFKMSEQKNGIVLCMKAIMEILEALNEPVTLASVMNLLKEAEPANLSEKGITGYDHSFDYLADLARDLKIKSTSINFLAQGSLEAGNFDLFLELLYNALKGIMREGCESKLNLLTTINPNSPHVILINMFSNNQEVMNLYFARELEILLTGRNLKKIHLIFHDLDLKGQDPADPLLDIMNIAKSKSGVCMVCSAHDIRMTFFPKTEYFEGFQSIVLFTKTAETPKTVENILGLFSNYYMINKTVSRRKGFLDPRWFDDYQEGEAGREKARLEFRDIQHFEAVLYGHRGDEIWLCKKLRKSYATLYARPAVKQNQRRLPYADIRR